MWTFFSQGSDDRYKGKKNDDDLEANSESVSLLSNASSQTQKNYYNGGSPRTPSRSSSRIKSLMSPNSSKKSQQQPLLLQSMLYWEVALPPLKQHVVGGKLVETLQASLYGNDSQRNLPVAKRRLTIEVFGHDSNDSLRRRRRRTRMIQCGGGSSLPSKKIDPFVFWEHWNELAEKDVVVLKVMKPRIVNEYDDDFGFGIHSSISEGLKDRKWESQSMSDKTMSWMMGLDKNDDDDEDEEDGNNHYDEEHHDQNSIVIPETTKPLQKRRTYQKRNIRWIELNRTRLSQIEIVRRDLDANEVDLKMGVGPRTVVQTFHFGDEYGRLGRSSSSGNAWNFTRILELLQKLERERAQRLALVHKGLLLSPSSLEKGGSASNSVKSDDHNSSIVNADGSRFETEMVSILIEIVSATNLTTPERRDPSSIRKNLDDLFVPLPSTSCDPYVVVRDGRTDIHSTSVIYDTSNPIWTLKSGSLCLMQSPTLLEFFERSNVLEFNIKNNHGISDGDSDDGDETIGTVMIHKAELLEGTGERKYYEILLPPQAVTNKIENATLPYLYLRYKPASPEDIDFMVTLQEQRNENCGVYASDAILPPSNQNEHPFSRYTRNEIANGVLEYRIQPASDPQNSMKTEWMTPTQIEQSSKQHSRAWTLSGSGSIGKVYLEVLGCDSLPMRINEHTINSFVCIVYEDSVVNTDVIWDCLSPRWMPWSQRAFVLKMMHPSSQLFMGVFNKNNKLPGNCNEPLGRIIVNLTNLRPNAIHTLTYYLRNEDQKENSRGSITIRLRITLEDERAALLSGFWTTEDHYYVSTVDKSDFKCASYVLTNDPSQGSLSLRNLTNSTRELLEGTEAAIDSIIDALMVLILWRGHYPVTLHLCRREIPLCLPLHSMVAFSWAIMLAWDFQKCISFVCFFIGWALLATMEDQRKNPSVWRRPRSYWELLCILFRGKSGRPRRTILPNEQLEETEEFESKAEDRAKRRAKAIERWKAERRAQEETYWQEEELNPSNGSNGIMTEEYSSALLLAPFQSVLLPMQETLHKACVIGRIATSIVLWRDSYATFWIVTLCFSFSAVAFWIPWALLLKWGFTVVVLALFGPWMKLVDIYYFRRNPSTRGLPDSKEYEKLYRLLLGDEPSAARIHRENAIKLMDTKRYMFGQYLARVPILKEERHPSDAALSSSSIPYNTNPRPVNIVKRIHGQQLWGDMVPYQEYNDDDKGNENIG